MNVVSSDREIQAHYEECIRNGCTHKLAEMLAFQTGPCLNTDATFLKGECNGNSFENQPQAGDYYRKLAKKAGVSTTGKKYLSQLARYPGDPRAWVSGKSDVLRECRRQNISCHGAVTYKAHEVEPSKSLDGEVADSILDKFVDKELARNPGRKIKRADLKEELRVRHRRKK